MAVTGAGGFIGSWVVEALLAAGARVERLGFDGELQGCDSIVHLAYRRPTEGSSTPWASEWEDNVRPTAVLLHEAALAGVRHVCFASSTAVYSPPARHVAEDAPIGGRSVTPYARAKLAQEDLVRHWAAANRRTASVLRLATVYGPGETVPRAIPNFIRAALSGRPAQLDGAGLQVFDVVYVVDVARAFVAATGRRANGTFNVGTGVAHTPRAIAGQIARLCGRPAAVVENPHAAGRDGAVCDPSRARQELGLCRLTPLDAGLTAEIAWFRRKLEG